jgi:hypothetical protein
LFLRMPDVSFPDVLPPPTLAATELLLPRCLYVEQKAQAEHLPVAAPMEPREDDTSFQRPRPEPCSIERPMPLHMGAPTATTSAAPVAGNGLEP